ncbi:glycine dehydrogenase [Coprinopsis cinerea AmutBmut pab1-1]|nr:glycine dehydrogenase [Coprinopsis cinerea AmutBmut pab1-1]
MQAIFRTTVARARPARTFALRTAAFRPAQFRTVVSEYPLAAKKMGRLTLGGPTAKRYTTDHEAIAFDDSTGIGTVSITDYAQSSLGDVVFVELPSEGTEVAQGGEDLQIPPPPHRPRS